MHDFSHLVKLMIYCNVQYSLRCYICASALAFLMVASTYHVTITVYSSSEHQLRNWLSENASEKQVQVNDYYERFKFKSLPVDSTRGESYSCHL